MDGSKHLIDNHDRKITYLRLSVTDKCNLRCSYCMPAEGINFIRKDELLTYEELLKISTILIRNGIEKIRITGGEPFLRKDLIKFLEKLVSTKGLKKVSITTNGVLIKNYINDLKALGINDINLSLDTFDRDRFKKITGKDEFDTVRDTLFNLIDNEFNVKVNAVVMEGMNTEDILPLTRLSINLPIAVRFIEEMPFNGSYRKVDKLGWTHKRILEEIKTVFPSIAKAHTPRTSTSVNYKIPGAKGDVGIIAANSRTFCGTCNRIRINAEGKMKTCLYGPDVLDIKSKMRNNSSDKEILSSIQNVISKRAKDGFEAEKLVSNHNGKNESMSRIGG